MSLSPVFAAQRSSGSIRSTITKSPIVVFGKISYRLPGGSWTQNNVYVYQNRNFNIKNMDDGSTIKSGTWSGFLPNEQVRNCSGSKQSMMPSSNRIDLVTTVGNIGLKFENSSDYNTFLMALNEFRGEALTASEVTCNNVAKSGGKQRKTYKKKGKKGKKGKKTRKTKKTKRVKRRRSSKRK